MISMRKIAALVSVLPLSLGAAAVFGKDMVIDAKIQEVNNEDRSITVENEATGTTQTFRVDEDTEIAYERNLESGVAALRSGFEDLHAGQEIQLSYDDEAMDDEWVIVHVITIS